MMNPATKDFMGKPAPPGYIAGLGRGATGFTTRSDIGPAREASLAALQKDREQGDGGAGGDDERFADDPDNETGLFNSLPYEADDEEADRAFGAVDDRMAARRNKQRVQRENELKKTLARERPKITEQFADAKRELASVSLEEWDAIPDATNLSRRKTKKDLGRERFVPVPDSVLSGARASVEVSSTVVDGTKTDFVEMGEARDRVLGVKLDQVSDSVSGQTVVDPKGYLTDLNSMGVKSMSDISDIKKARLLLKSLTTTNPTNSEGWIGYARMEELAGRLVQARSIIAKGCENCPKSEDVWLEAARLNTIDNAKVILARAALQLPNSVKIWQHAANLEANADVRKRVIRRALEKIPKSVTLWRAAIDLEETAGDALIMLRQAVQQIPQEVDMWLTLAKLETYDNARKVLNTARKQIPTSHEIWIAAGMLEESQGNVASVNMIISKGIQTLAAKGFTMSREKWLDEAVACEEAEAVHTCRAIISNTIGLELEQEDWKSTWVADAESCIAKKHIECARAIYKHAVAHLPTKKSLWRSAAFLEMEHGTRDALLALLESAVAQVPHDEVLWLMAAKEQWKAGDLDAARKTLVRAFQANPSSPEIWLAAVKLEQENGEYDRAQAFLTRARQQAGKEPRVWMKSAVLERIRGDLGAAIDLLKVAVERFPTYAKLWMIWGQIEEQRGNIAAARNVFEMAFKHAPKSIPLWICAAQLEERAGILARSRALLDRARLINPNTPALWHEAIDMEHRAGNTAMARSLMSKSLQECPTSGLLWGQSIFLEQRPARRARSVDALKRCGESDAAVILAVARFFWTERKLDKARNWLERAVLADADNGDAWAYWYRFEVEHGTAEQQNEVATRCIAAAPKHGIVWPRVAKDVANVRKSVEDVLHLVAAQVSATT
ncbi:U4/U6 x U5 tri-snRNP complex subunit Prp1 [Blastocladiella emersonii ATCC 22665]|nr:U4/U6 x U5 tri-snRNP complex subunit Prp1 [Blastocladiella emersonii ATCC 22665]